MFNVHMRESFARDGGLVMDRARMKQLAWMIMRFLGLLIFVPLLVVWGAVWLTFYLMKEYLGGWDKGTRVGA